MSSGAGNPVLKALDKAQTQAYHFKAIVIAGMGFFTDAYDLFVIGLLTKLLGRIYYYNPDKPTTVGQLPPNVYSAVTAVALCGTLAGQLFFGWAGDKFGRKKVYGITLALMVVASLAQGLSFGHTSTSVIVTLCFFRFWLGFGIGGDYPLSATIMSEYSNSRTRGAFVACVFAMQGIGYLFAAAVCIIVVSGFNNYYPAPTFQASPVNSTPLVADWVWRIVLMFGAVPAALTFYSRSKMPETARYTALVESDQRRAALDMEKVLNTHFESTEEEQQEVEMRKKQRRAGQYGLFTRQFVRRHGTELMACSVTWFLLDASYYSQNLFQSQIFSATGWIPPTSHMSALEETFKNARAQAYIALCGTVPGYWFTVAFVDLWGRRPIQIMGFAMMSLFMYILAFDFYGLRGHYHSANGTITGGNHAAFIILYAFTFFFSNFGPNTTTFIIPAELFPARLRSTCSGIAAATGKAGSIVGTFGFLYASQDSHASRVTPGYPPGIGYKYSFLVLAICATVGCVVSILFTPETKGRSLEDLSGEDEENNAIADGGGDMEEGDGDKV